ncbi:uncharacterized protein LOC142568128 [Dermacentor variabilis]|uniref:uncharacterized protein LOC142568128 n=1 Tax=Dermacentor variabilis TaxID=34621 RepID=UPI003F5B50D7
MVKRLKHLVEKAAGAEEKSISSRKVDIGDGVLVEEGTLARIKNDSNGSACRYARGLLRATFAPEELINKSLFGKRSNAHKDFVAKEGLDPRRVNAVLGMYAKSFCALKDICCNLKCELCILLPVCANTASNESYFIPHFC